MMRNIVFDLGGVLFNRPHNICTPDFIEFFSFVRQEPMPDFWTEYDRGTLALDEVIDILCRVKGCSRGQCAEYVRQAIALQRPVGPTESLIGSLRAAGYHLYVLSNMSLEFIRFLRRYPVYEAFEGEVVSCEEGSVKPEPRIYEVLLARYGLDPAATLFIDDRQDNLDAAARFGIGVFRFDHKDPEQSCLTLRQMLLG